MRLIGSLYSRYTWAVVWRHYLVWKNLRMISGVGLP